MGCNRIFVRVIPSFDFSYFFLNPIQFQPRVGRVSSQSAGSGFKSMGGTERLEAKYCNLKRKKILEKL
jgi:hypothetical protein